MDENLVAVDGPARSAKVVDIAVELARAIHAHIQLVNLAPDVPVPDCYAGCASEERVDPSSCYEKVSEGGLGDTDHQAHSHHLSHFDDHTGALILAVRSGAILGGPGCVLSTRGKRSGR